LRGFFFGIFSRRKSKQIKHNKPSTNEGFVFVLFISRALACPDTSGKYASYRSSTGEISGSKDIVIEQKIINKIHHISMSATDDETQERATDHL
jgi:hypothetical protein